MTIKEAIISLAGKETTSEEDDRIMLVLCKRFGFDKARVVYGIVYLEGRGTLEAPPMSIGQLAKMFLDSLSVT